MGGSVDGGAQPQELNRLAVPYSGLLSQPMSTEEMVLLQSPTAQYNILECTPLNLKCLITCV